MSQKINKLTHRQALERFDELALRIKKATQYDDAYEPEHVQAKRIKRARADYGYFVETYFPHYASVACAWFHIAAAKIILKHPVLRFVAAWFRGAAKSVHMDIMIPLWLKVQEPRGFNTMVLVGNNQTAATILLSDLQNELENNQLYARDFGEQKKVGSWEEGKFTTADGCAFFALGLRQSPRGLRKMANRPDLIIVDDIDDDEMVLNEYRVDKAVDWINKSLILAMDLGRGRVLFANNIIHEKSIISKMIAKYQQILKVRRSRVRSGEEDAPLDTHYEIMIINVLDKDGRPSWPEKMSLQEVRDRELELGYADAQTELYNNPVSKGKVFKKDWIQYAPMKALNKYSQLIAYFDPGYKNTETSDSMALILLGLERGDYHVVKAYCDKCSRMEAVGWHYDLQEWLDHRGASCLFYMEEKFQLDLLYDDFEAASLERGYPISVIGDTRNKPDKDLRIKSTAGAFERGRVYFNKAEEHNHHMQNLVSQFLAFEPPKKTLKDGPDAVEGGMFYLRQYRQQTTTDQPVIGAPRSRTVSRY